MGYERLSKRRVLVGSIIGDIQAAAGSIGTTELADLAVTSAKLAAGSNAGLSVINKTGSSIAADKVVALAGIDGTAGKFKIVLADADVAAYDDLYVTTAAIADNATGTVYKSATSAANLNTNSFTTVGDPVYLSTTAGGFTQTAPTTAISRVAPVGAVLVKSATVGQILWKVGPVRIIGTNEIQAAGVLKTNLAGGFSKITVANGVDETSAHSITVAGMAVGDEIVGILTLTTAASIATLVKHGGTFVAASGAITTSGAEVNNTNNQYIIFWNDLT